MLASIIVSFVTTLMTIIAAWIFPYREFKREKRRRENEQLSRFNKWFLTNPDIQTVVKYLRDDEPSDEEPTTYQVEIFMRFFEEIGLYLKYDSIRAKDIYVFFGYYVIKLTQQSCERAQILCKKIKLEDYIQNTHFRYFMQTLQSQK